MIMTQCTKLYVHSLRIYNLYLFLAFLHLQLLLGEAEDALQRPLGEVTLQPGALLL